MTSYVIVIERAIDNFSAYAPNLPRCIATGRTLEEVTENMRSAIDLHIEGLEDDGQEVPAPRADTARIVVAV